jgi:hypothetical protein
MSSSYSDRWRRVEVNYKRKGGWETKRGAALGVCWTSGFMVLVICG